MRRYTFRDKLRSAVLYLALLAATTACIRVGESRQPEASVDDGFLARALPNESPDFANRIVFIVSGDLYTVSADGVDTVGMGTGSAYGVAWSPDGDALLVNLKQPGSNPLNDLVAASGSDWLTNEHILSSVFMCAGIDWSPDGNSIIYTGGLPQALWPEGGVGVIGVYTADRDGTNLQLVTECDSPACCSPEWSPDGARIAFIDAEGVEVVEPDNPGSRHVVYSFSTEMPVACYGKNTSWFPDSQRLLISDGLKIRVLNLVDNSVTTLFEIAPQAAEGYLWAIVLPDGEHIVYRANYKETECNEGLACYHREVMLANLSDMVWRDITPDIGDRFDLSYLDWWQTP